MKKKSIAQFDVNWVEDAQQGDPGKLLSPGRVSQASGRMAGMLSPTNSTRGAGPIRALHNSTMSSMGGNETVLTSPHHRTIALEEIHQQNLQKASKNLQHEYE